MRFDPTPDKGRALGRLEAKQGRSVAKGRRADGDEPDAPQTIPLGGG
ncbi:MAG: hypothetical protein Q8M79_03700 [Dehalococcoidia bacterium]|nr:hypothetical protein [Dehalococcoidia bacterium]